VQDERGVTIAFEEFAAQQLPDDVLGARGEPGAEARFGREEGVVGWWRWRWVVDGW
jgi:hypothetical protein